jgi:glutathione S-transferase
MSVQKLTLISHHLCPYVQRAAIVLAEKDIPFERVYVDLSAKPDWFTTISPLGKVPLLVVRRADGSEAVIFESAVICEYIDEALSGPRLHPADPLARAGHRAWMEFGSAVLGDVWGLETARDEAGYLAKAAALAAKFARVEAALGDGPFFSGDTFSLVDAVFAPVFRYFDVFDTLSDSHAFDGLPKVGAWRRSLSCRASVTGAVTADYERRLLEFLDRHDAFLVRGTRAVQRSAA